MTDQLMIRCDKIEDRIKEQHLAEKRGWCHGCYGRDNNEYYVYYTKKQNKKKKKLK